MSKNSSSNISWDMYGSIVSIYWLILVPFLCFWNSSSFTLNTIYLFIYLFIYSNPTSFGKKKKYDHFSFLCKQMDIYLRKSVHYYKGYLSADIFGLIQYLSAWHISHATSSKNRFLKRISWDQLCQLCSSCLLLLHMQIKIIVDIL